jgi:hypothetical protein
MLKPRWLYSSLTSIRLTTRVPIDTIVRRVGEKWAATGDYLGYWVGGFDTQEDAELFADAIESAVDDAKDAVLRS